LAACFVLGMAVPALAYYEPTDGPAVYYSCSCHHPGSDIDACQKCHGYNTEDFPFYQGGSVWDPPPQGALRGPHGNYSATTSKCDACHTVHDAPSQGTKLLPAATLVDTCFTCHDGTQGFGVYGALKARTGKDPRTDLTLGSHRVGVTSEVPGGDAASGGSQSRTFRDPSGLLTCGDCHSVHGNDLVAPFAGERKRTRSAERQYAATSKLLRRQPTTAPQPVNEYGSDWCVGCHSGRSSGSAVMNHPVETVVTWPNEATRFVFRRVAGGRHLAWPTGSDGRHDDFQLGFGGLGNGDFLMPEPRLPEQGVHLPICQQCHEDTRDVGDLAADGSRPATNTYVASSADGILAAENPTDHVAVDPNPRFQNFPHETENDKFVIETGDDLCLNCHASSNLP